MLVVGDLPQVEHRYAVAQFLDREPARVSTGSLKRVRQERGDNLRLAVGGIALDAARGAAKSAREAFANELTTALPRRKCFLKVEPCLI